MVCDLAGEVRGKKENCTKRKDSKEETKSDEKNDDENGKKDEDKNGETEETIKRESDEDKEEKEAECTNTRCDDVLYEVVELLMKSGRLSMVNHLENTVLYHDRPFSCFDDNK